MPYPSTSPRSPSIGSTGARASWLGRAGRQVERGLSRGAAALWPAVERLNLALEQPGRLPGWSDKPLQKRRDKTRPELGFPRETDSLCPRCVKEVRDAVVAGHRDLAAMMDDHPGEIRARIVEEDGQVLMKKTCPTHGEFVDVLAMDVAFLRRIEGLFPGRDVETTRTALRAHGSSTMKYGRGAVLTVDLTNRCNMMCEPCFMDANQVGYVHELGWDDTKKLLDDAISVKPRRQMSIQFSGGEPTLSPHFLEAVSYAREVGYFAVQCATNGIRFAEDADFARQAKAAGLRMAYLQFDGVGEEANAHRKIGNLFEVKLRAIENLHAAGIDVILVVTVVGGVNDHQVGKIVEFAALNADKITVVSFQPVAFTGRDEDIDEDLRRRQRYTLSHLAHGLEDQTGGALVAQRDWFPLSAMTPFSDLTDVLLADDAKFGSVSCGCHPNCGTGTILFVHKETKEVVPLTRFLDLEGLLRDVGSVADAHRGRALTMAEVALALLKNFDATQAPPGLSFTTLVKQFLSQTGARGKRVGQFESDAGEFAWRVLFVAGMHFQDLWNYDFRRTEMCIIPYATQAGEISFCAYNTGVGFRQVVESMHKTASVAEWFADKGRHPIYAKNQDLPLPPALGTVKVPDANARVRLRVVA